MSVRLDPEDHELAALLALTGDLTGRRVLEIGCGDGRLTWRYAHLAGHVTGIDPLAERVAEATTRCPAALRERVTFHAADLATFQAADRFDLALLSWSL